MTRQEEIEYLKKYRKALIYITGYKTEEEKQSIKEEPQKVKVLKKTFNKKDSKAA